MGQGLHRDRHGVTIAAHSSPSILRQTKLFLYNNPAITSILQMKKLGLREVERTGNLFAACWRPAQAARFAAMKAKVLVT